MRLGGVFWSGCRVLSGSLTSLIPSHDLKMESYPLMVAKAMSYPLMVAKVMSYPLNDIKMELYPLMVEPCHVRASHS